MPKKIFLSICLLTASCGVHDAADHLQSGKVMPLFGLSGRWAGPVTPKSDGCGQASTGLMSIDGAKFAFDPFQGTTVIDGTISGNTLAGALSRPVSGQETVSIQFSGETTQRDGGEDMIEGDLVSGHCSWAVSLKRA